MEFDVDHIRIMKEGEQHPEYKDGKNMKDHEKGLERSIVKTGTE